MSALAPTTLLQGRIPILAFRIVTVITFAIAISAVVGRLIALYVQRKKMRLDDALLVTGTICMIAGTAVLLYGLDDIYFIEQLQLNGVAAIATAGPTWVDRLISYQKINWAYLTLTWACIFFVKFSFLAFFRDLCDRLPKINLYRKIVFVFCVLVCIYAILDGFVACPKLGLAALDCSKPENFKTSLIIGAIAITLDMATDILILIIPITLLWQVKLRAYQKMGIGIFLCLSVVMIIMAIVRVSGIHYYDTTDNSWIYLWQQLEASAAVTMISLTAFRSVFVQNNQRSKYKYSPWEASIPKFFKKMRRSSIDSQDLNLNDLQVPRAHMTGMRTFIGRDDTAVEEQKMYEPTYYGTRQPKPLPQSQSQPEQNEPYSGILKTTQHVVEHHALRSEPRQPVPYYQGANAV